MHAHESVMLQEALDGLAIRPDGIYIDATFGRGGHTQAILERLSPSGRLIAIDRDPDAVNFAKEKFEADARFSIFYGSFAQVKEVAMQAGVAGQVDGVLFDLGLSSPQIDNPERGFSFMQNGPLDMRMDTEQGLKASDFINTAPEKTLVEIFFLYGEERFSRRIANAIVLERQKHPIETTSALAEIVKEANPKWEKHKHPATRVFQAIRIHVNQELDALKTGLDGAFDVLGIGGRLAVISFHSLEDRIVKQFMKLKSEGLQIPHGVPIRTCELNITFKRIGKAIKPSTEEIRRNVRARSAVLRIGEKLA
jgi:16S rRNA (cytosine1402-N4)-methyltransferase